MINEHSEDDCKAGDLPSLLDALVPAFENKAFLIDDACIAAVHYGYCFDGMRNFSFAMTREDYESLFNTIVSTVRNAGFRCESVVAAGNGSFRRPFISVMLANPPSNVLFDRVDVLPLDEIPVQKTIRFRIFRQAKKALSLYSDMKSKDVYDSMSDYEARFHRVMRYDGRRTGLVANLVCPEREKGKTIFQRSVSVERLFPIRSMPLCGCNVPVPQSVANWTGEMTEKREKVVRTVQREGLKCLCAMDKACESLDLNYFLVGGSMLGAVRHGGFIPWDDDSDVGMLRKDYKRFCRRCSESLGRGFFLQLPGTDRHSHFVYARLRMDGLKYISNYNEDKHFHKGIWVDIFPFDARPKSERIAGLQRKAASLFARKSMNLRRKREYVAADLRHGSDGLLAEDKRYLHLYYAVSLLFPIALFRLAYHTAARFFNPFLSRSKNAVFASFVPSYTTISKAELFPIKKVRFEGVNLCIPNDADGFLSRQYGDYSSLPPAHERCAEHGFKYLITPDGERIEA